MCLSLLFVIEKCGLPLLEDYTFVATVFSSIVANNVGNIIECLLQLLLYGYHDVLIDGGFYICDWLRQLMGGGKHVWCRVACLGCTCPIFRLACHKSRKKL